MAEAHGREKIVDRSSGSTPLFGTHITGAAGVIALLGFMHLTNEHCRAQDAPDSSLVVM